jgi:hypothetical protein
MYAPGTLVNVPQGQLSNLTGMMAATSLGTSPRSPGYMHMRPDLAVPAQAAPHPPPAQAAYPLPNSSMSMYPVGHPIVNPVAQAAPRKEWPPIKSAAANAAVSPRPPPAAQALPSSLSTHPQPPVAMAASSVPVPARSVSHPAKNPASGYPGVPLTPAQTLNRYGGVNVLTEYEQGEVLNHPRVYYVGAGAEKHHPHPTHRATLRTLERWCPMLGKRACQL